MLIFGAAETQVFSRAYTAKAFLMARFAGVSLLILVLSKRAERRCHAVTLPVHHQALPTGQAISRRGAGLAGPIAL